LKFLSYVTAILLTANFAVAQSISDKELQERFNKAFSIFNQQGKTAETGFNEISNQENSKVEKQEESISITDESEKNIVKTSNNEVITSQETELKTEKLTLPTIQTNRPSNAANFVLLRERSVLIDMQNATLKQVVQEALNQVTHGEKWTIRWRLKDENKYLLKERINLTAEVTFDSFISNMLETITNITGIRLSTKVFNQNRIIIITDSF
jgi:hypothetical protein|tara:strand:+ start:1624 stop:2256 length:633 start_codon:yes stop_codon:yes gene_type:complete